MAPPLIPLIRKLAKSRKKEANGCWVWTGAKDRDGYGVVGHGRNKQLRVHRASYGIFKGEIPTDKIICHKCDNKPCFNPDHLYAGTPKQNTADMFERSNPSRLKGEDHPNSKLTRGDVADIRSMRSKGVKLVDIAAKYKIAFQTVSSIYNNTTWRD